MPIFQVTPLGLKAVCETTFGAEGMLEAGVGRPGIDEECQSELADIAEPLQRRGIQQRQRQLLELIQGSGELRTFLAQLNREARASGVQLEGYEPISAAPVSPAPPIRSPRPTRFRSGSSSTAYAGK